MTVTVLIAEDEPMIGRILAEKLTREGHAVQRASTTTALADALGSCDIALVDMTLDDDGIDVMRRLGGSGVRPRIGWFAMLESRSAGDGARAVQAGAAGVILKPFKPTAVAAKVTALVEALVR
jgi:DNA-binding response OmpR family regulator